MAAATHEVRDPTNTGVDNRKLLMWIFLASECLFFGALLSTYLVFKGDLSLPPFPSDTIVPLSVLEDAIAAGLVDAHTVEEMCSPHGAVGDYECHGILDIPITSTSTFVLLMSSLAMVLAVFGAQNHRPGMMKFWLLVTALLGLAFLGFQVYEFRTFGAEGLNLSTSQFGSSFFVLTGFHGTHVAVGVLILLSVLGGSFRRNSLGPETGFHIEIVGLYWHFVDVVWIVLFTVIYLIPA